MAIHACTPATIVAKHGHRYPSASAGFIGFYAGRGLVIGSSMLLTVVSLSVSSLVPASTHSSFQASRHPEDDARALALI